MLKEPSSMEDLIYFTRRQLGKSGFAIAWAERQPCPKCKKAKMGKPVGKEGSVKIRAKEYECPSCKYTVEKEEYEDTLTCCVKYTCPHCAQQGEISTPFKRKKVTIIDEEGGGKKVSVDAVRFECGSCKKAIDIVKKMKR